MSDIIICANSSGFSLTVNLAPTISCNSSHNISTALDEPFTGGIIPKYVSIPEATT